MPRKGTTKYNSTRQENRVAEEVGGKTVIASGSLWGSKGDVRSDKFLVECKTTGGMTYPLHLTTWKKIEKEAINDGLRVPVMCVDLADGGKRLAIVNETDFEGILHYGSSEFTEKTAGKQTSVGKEYVRIVFDHDIALLVIPWEDFLEIQNYVEGL
jgi:hypothetical protein